MPLFDRSTISAGPSKPPNMSGVLGKPTLTYNGSYVVLDPRGRDGAAFSPPWSNSKAALAEGMGPGVSHLSGTVGQSHIRQNFALYPNHSDVSSQTSSADMRKPKSGCDSMSPSENSFYFALPKPVYRPGHCCNEHRCVMGSAYSVEHSSRMPNSLIEHEWVQSEVPYSKVPLIQRKGPDALLQQRNVPFEPTMDSLHRINVDPYHSNRVRTLPDIMKPNFPRYHCAPTLYAPLSDHSQPVQTAPRGYPSLYSSQQTYEHMTSEVYQEPSPMTKYGHLPHHPVFYCPQAKGDAEQRAQCKEANSKLGEDVPVIHKHSIPNTLEHCIVTQSLHGDIPLPFPSTEMLPVHPFMQGFSYPCYAVPRVHSNANQMRSPLKSQQALPVFNYSLLTVSPSAQHKDHPRTSPTSPNKDKSTLRVDQVGSPTPFMCVNQTSPTRHLSQPGTSPPNIQMTKLFPTLAGLPVNPAVLSPIGLNLNRLVDFLPYQIPETYQKPTAAWLSHADQIHTATDRPPIQNGAFSPLVATECKHSGSLSSSGSPVDKEGLKRKHSNLSPPIKIKQEDLYEGVIRKKLKKLNYQPAGSHMDSPPMPVIDNVFSLAHYQAYPKVSTESSGDKALLNKSSSENCEDKQGIKRTKLDPDEPHPDCAVTSKEIIPNAPAELDVKEAVEPPKVKVEDVDPSEVDPAVEPRVSQSDCIQVIIKRECEDSDVSDGNATNECKSEELTSPSEIQSNSSNGSQPAAFGTNQKSPSQGNVHHHLPKPPLPSDSNPLPQQPQPPKALQKVHVNSKKKSPDQNIFPEIKESSPVAARTLTALAPQRAPQIPVRKHFFELHHSFCKLVSESVSASSEQELKDWLCQQEIGPVTPSSKVQKVSCLLGVKAREVWIKEEMKSALSNILQRLTEYTAMERCPFPHVMRTGAVFLPMLVVKELLFPMVQGSLVDKVLQEHKVELRPTTLSEEKILIQLHKRAASYKLRRLMSLKHLPDIYADVVNILYYTSVCKRLGVDRADRDVDDSAPENWMSAVFSDVTPAEFPSDFQPPQSDVKEQEVKPPRSRTKSRVKSSSRRMFLDCSVSDEEEVAANAQKGNSGARVGNRVSEKVALQKSPLVLQSIAARNSWMCPLSDSDGEMEDSVRPADPSTVGSRGSSGMILRLRRMFGGLNRKSACYQSVPVSDTLGDPSLCQTENQDQSHCKHKTPTVTQRLQRVGNFSRPLKSLSSPSKRKPRSLLQIKYCPYLSACHSGKNRRRCVLRSAVQRAHVDVRMYYPDLVGKTIRHLYEEDDKSEVWYRGEVLRVHEADANPLKTIFEVRYDSEPEWKYYLELLMDYKKGWLKIED